MQFWRGLCREDTRRCKNRFIRIQKSRSVKGFSYPNAQRQGAKPSLKIVYCCLYFGVVDFYAYIEAYANTWYTKFN